MRWSKEADEEEDVDDDWRVEQSLYAQRQFQTDFNTFDDSDDVSRNVLASDWDSIKSNTALIELLEKCEEAGAKHDEKKHKSRLKLAKQRAQAVEEYKLELEKQRVAISGLEDIEVEGEVQAALPEELQKEVEMNVGPRGLLANSEDPALSDNQTFQIYIPRTIRDLSLIHI